MNREEFLDILATQLAGAIPSHEISQHLAYYNTFIDQKLRQGQTEADILEGLGDPRLIAKTLIDTEDVPNVHGYRQSYAYSAEEAGPDSFTPEGDPSRDSAQRPFFSTWYGKLTFAASLALLAIFLFMLLRVAIPVAAVVVFIVLIVSLIDRRR